MLLIMKTVIFVFAFNCLIHTHESLNVLRDGNLIDSKDIFDSQDIEKNSFVPSLGSLRYVRSVEDLDKHNLTNENKTRRDINELMTSLNSTFSTSIATSFPLNDSHEQLIVHWAGQASPVIICLAKSSPPSITWRNQTIGSRISSSIYFSYDYGNTFVKNLNAFNLPNTNISSYIDTFYLSPTSPARYIFVNVNSSLIFTTINFGKDIKPIQLEFRPKTLFLHPKKQDWVLAKDDHDVSQLWLSQDFGTTWKMILSGVKEVYWGIDGVDNEMTIIAQKIDSSSNSNRTSITTNIIISNNFFKDEKQLLTNVIEFEVKGKFMFATRKVKLLGYKNETGKFYHHETRPLSLQLWVSFMRENFTRAIFPEMKSLPIDYYVADASDNELMVCVTFNDSVSNLYMSQLNGTQFELSLENIVYFAMNLPIKNAAGLEWKKEEPMIDLHKVAGLESIYIASQWKNSKRAVSDMISVITFDKGVTWNRISSPKMNVSRNPIECKESANCSLHLGQKFSSMYPNLRFAPILSRSSAPGLIMSSGVIGDSINGTANTFLSSDAGHSWRKVFDGNYLFSFGDYGGIIVAVAHFSKNGATNELSYSIDEGETWEKIEFSKEKVRVFGLMTEPGENTTIFTLFGSEELKKHAWILYKVDLSSMFHYKCQMPQDYVLWTPTSTFESSNIRCLSNQTKLYYRRISSHKCYNGLNFVRTTQTKNCSLSSGQLIYSMEAKATHSSNFASIILPLFAIMLIMIVTVGFFVLRHRRIRSFRNLFTHHYFTRSGSATFSAGLEEDDETPVFRGFSDDEPLVLA